MKKIFFYMLFFIPILSCADETARIVTVKIQGGNDVGEVSQVYMLRSYKGEEIERIDFSTTGNGSTITKEFDFVKDTQLNFIVSPSSIHNFEYTGDIVSSSPEESRVIDSDFNVNIIFKIKPDVTRPPDNNDANKDPLIATEYYVANMLELRWIIRAANIGDVFGSVPQDFSTKTIFLKNDINMNGDVSAGIKSFGGTFDGAGFAIQNIVISNDIPGINSLGFINSLSTTGIVKNLSVTGTLLSTVAQNVGGIVGDATGGTIEKSSSGVNITASATALNVGGISGLGGIIKESYNTGKISVASSTANAGGITGKMVANNNISDCYNTGEIDLSLATGGAVGGIAALGVDATTTVLYVYNIGRISAAGGANVGGVLGSGFGGTAGTTYVYYHLSDTTFNSGINGNGASPVGPPDLYALSSTGFATIPLGTASTVPITFDGIKWAMKTGLPMGSGNNIVVPVRPALIGVGAEGK